MKKKIKGKESPSLKTVFDAVSSKDEPQWRKTIYERNRKVGEELRRRAIAGLGPWK
jgi:hypothetical protein